MQNTTPNTVFNRESVIRKGSEMRKKKQNGNLESFSQTYN